MPTFSSHWWVLTLCGHSLTSVSSLDTLCGDGLAWRRGGVGFGQVVIAGASSSPLNHNAKSLIVPSISSSLPLCLFALLNVEDLLNVLL